MKQNFLLIALCFISLTNAMEQKKLIVVPCSTEIPQHVCNKIWQSFHRQNGHYPLLETAQTFKALTCTNKSFQSFFYDLNNLKSIIKEISTSLNCSNQRIVKELSFNQKIRQIGALQESFLNYCRQDIDSTSEQISLILSRYKKDGVDLDFTYQPNKNTALIEVLEKTKYYSQQHDPVVRTLWRIHTDFSQKIIACLIQNDADVFLIKNHDKMSAFSYILSHHQQFVSLLKKLGKLKINAAHKCLFADLHYASTLLPNCIDVILEAAQILLDAGANPESPYKISAITPSEQSISTITLNYKYNPQFVEFMEKAIAAKHDLKKS